MLFDLDNCGIIFYDGGFGTMLQKRGLKSGSKPDLMNMTAPDTVGEIHKLYIEAGSNIISTNTFGASPFLLESTGYTCEEVITAAVGIAKRAVKEAASDTKVALDIGPIGQLIEPIGDLEPESASKMFAQQAVAGEKAGADLVTIETMSDLNEMEIAIKAVSENTKLPIFAMMTFDAGGHTFMGVTTSSFIKAAEALGATAIGINCSLEPKVMLPVAKQFAEETNLPLIFKLNAGLPDGITGRYSVDPKEFALQMLPYVDIGMKIVGGCCGTTPEHIAELKRELGN